MLCELSIQIQCQIANFLRAILRKGAIHTCTTAAQSMEGTASFFSHLLDLNKEVSSVSFKFKSTPVARSTPTRNVPNKVQRSLMVSNSLNVAERSRFIGCKKPCFEEKYVVKFLWFRSYCYNSHLGSSCNAEFTRFILQRRISSISSLHCSCE